MSWQAPALTHLLEQRLQTARLELMDDPRLLRAQQGQGQENGAFLRQLIDEKFSAAARSGLGAIEASLRTHASAHLADAGLDAGSVRATLDGLGEEILALHKVPAHIVPPEAQSPLRYAAAFYIAWLFTIFAGWMVSDKSFRLVLALAGAGFVAAVALFLLVLGSRQKRRVTVAREYPARCCHYYLNGLTAAIGRYEEGVRALSSRRGE